MGLSADQLKSCLDALAQEHPPVAQALAATGYPEPRLRPRGCSTMMRAIVAQQVSTKAAASIWARLEAACGGDMNDLARVAATPFETLRGAGLSGQKASYVHALAEAAASGQVDFAALPADDEEAIALLSSIRGIGRWSAEIYLLFAEGRPDVFPAGDLALQVQLGRLLGEDARPSEKRARALAEPMRPHRGALSIFLWHNYNIVAL
ncbi:DNA-3-methyladenine glycosylase family protein [Sandarakinorhabdus rubra]|uniref:DNA-3-methyladenine glycosylase family protein n=1 Tax=Sandarakinorhabdus rubra TaxID=2672568 RepID=UPI0013DB90F1|nr:DNA-3-methyladenine glycosylase 2 family protein [Sandarakinorhabdus rubra]